jgi:hypothetical protein
VEGVGNVLAWKGRGEVGGPLLGSGDGKETPPVALPSDLWHLAFVNLIQDRAPPSFEIQSEVRLTVEPQRADMLLLRRIGEERHDDRARVLRALWPRLGLVTVLEYKSPIDSAFRSGDLLRLVGYGVLYDTAHLDALPRREDLTLVLVVASVTPSLIREIGRMGWSLTSLGGGYGRIDEIMYTTYVVVTDEVTEAERDEYLRLFSHRPASPGEATRWLQQWMRDTKMKRPDIEEVPGWDEMMRKFLQKLPPSERVEGLTPEERLEGLTPEAVPDLPLWMLRAFSDEYLRSLPPAVEEKVRARLRGAAH